MININIYSIEFVVDVNGTLSCSKHLDQDTLEHLDQAITTLVVPVPVASLASAVVVVAVHAVAALAQMRGSSDVVARRLVVVGLLRMKGKV